MKRLHWLLIGVISKPRRIWGGKKSPLRRCGILPHPDEGFKITTILFLLGVVVQAFALPIPNLDSDGDGLADEEEREVFGATREDLLLDGVI